MTLREQLDGAILVMADNERELTLAWFGGHGVHAYNDIGEEVSFWNTGDYSQNDADPADVRESMEHCISTGEYP